MPCFVGALVLQRPGSPRRSLQGNCIAGSHVHPQWDLSGWRWLEVLEGGAAALHWVSPGHGLLWSLRLLARDFILRSRAGQRVHWDFSARVCMMGDDKPGVFLVSGLPVRGKHEMNASASMQIKLWEIMSNLPIHAEGRDRSCLQLQLLTCESPKYARYLFNFSV